MEINQIYNIDALELLKGIDDKSCNLILTDPPFALDFSKYDTLSDKGGRKFHYTEKLLWDKGFDLKGMSEKLFPEFDRILKDDGSIIMFGPQEWGAYFFFPAKENHFHLKGQIIWEKDNPIPNLRCKNYRSTHECIVWFARWDEKKCLYTFNWKGQRLMKNVIKMPILQGEERLDHPTQKSLKLIKFLLEVHSNPNDLVVDPFSGVATTELACLMTGRRFIGSEIDKHYFELGNKRLEGWKQQTKLEVEDDGFGNVKLK